MSASLLTLSSPFTITDVAITVLPEISQTNALGEIYIRFSITIKLFVVCLKIKLLLCHNGVKRLFQYFLSIDDVDALDKLAQALTCEVIDGSPLFRLPEGRNDACCVIEVEREALDTACCWN